MHYGPVVKNANMQICLDALNPKSYSGSGTTWTDIGLSGNNGTLTNSPTFNSDGYFSFDGTDDYVALTQFSFDTDNGTIEIWLKSAAVDYTSNYAGRGIFIGHNGNKYHRLWALVTDASYSVSIETDTNEDYIPSGIVDEVDNNWNQIVTSCSGGTCKTYLNGVEQYEATGETNDILINEIVGSNSTANFQGDIALFRHYNVGLTGAEVIQTYEATRGRFA